MQTLGRPSESHRMSAEDGVDALTGEQYRLWTCPICGRQEKETDMSTVTLEEGNAPTAEDAIRFAEMAKTPGGRTELSAILRQYPGHDKVMIDQAGVNLLIEELGVEPAVTTGPPLTLIFRQGG